MYKIFMVGINFHMQNYADFSFARLCSNAFLHLILCRQSFRAIFLNWYRARAFATIIIWDQIFGAIVCAFLNVIKTQPDYNKAWICTLLQICHRRIPISRLNLMRILPKFSISLLCACTFTYSKILCIASDKIFVNALRSSLSMLHILMFLYF